MRIERVQVEEGFLADLDLTFAPGLNVLIGPRGTGKTSVLELIRFCLGAEPFDDRESAVARQHALAVLGSGRVTVTLTDEGDRVVVTRSGEDEAGQASGQFALPIVLGQNEIEGIGLSRGGRLRLLDQFRPDLDSYLQRSRLLRSKLESQTIELAALTREIAAIDEQGEGLKDIETQLAVAEKRQSEALASAAATQAEEGQLGRLQTDAANIAAQADVVQRSHTALEQWSASLTGAIRAAPSIEKWPDSERSDDKFLPLRKSVDKVSSQLRSALSEIRTSISYLTELTSNIDSQRRTLSDQAREIRVRLDTIQQGFGAVTRQVAVLREKSAQLGALRGLRAERSSTHSDLFRERGKTYEELEGLRAKRYRQRQEVAAGLNARLGPTIRISVGESEIDDIYSNAVASGLRGSGLHYSVLAPQLADLLSPRELVESVERADVRRIAQAGDISDERALKIIESLRSSGTSEIISAVVEDGVHLALLDGKEYKDSENLSTGQRCTVVLPIVLAESGSSLVLDQPEDHLDNAFVTRTLLPAIMARKSHDQLIIATHNPNIAVLGDSELVTLMGSDGKRGFVRHSAPLDDPQSVLAITTVMEGGMDAFRRRAKYYREHTASELH